MAGRSHFRIVAAAAIAVCLGALGSLALVRHVSVEARPQREAPRQRDEARLAADCEQMANWVRRLLGSWGHAIVRPPLVIGGDLSEEALERWYREEIAPAAGAMAGDYFDTPPDEPITILLFSDRSRYRQQASRLLGRQGVSRHGHYRPHLRMAIVNVSDGAGPLRHELAHALMAFDFPDAPDWLAEGLASLCETCRIGDSQPRLAGTVGRRLPVLRDAIRQRRLASFAGLLGDAEFRRGPTAIHYAHARYFCLDLQRRALLREFYREFRRQHNEDPTGEATLRRMLGNRPWSDIDAGFRRWVMELEP